MTAFSINPNRQTTSVLPDEYRARDLNAAAFLLLNNIVLARTEVEQGMLLFIFPGFKQCTQILRAYFSGEAVGNLKEFVDAQRKIKRLITEYRKQQELAK